LKKEEEEKAEEGKVQNIRIHKAKHESDNGHQTGF
jgi:hypothetical protein